MAENTITTSVRNNSGAWEVIEREPGNSLADVENGLDGIVVSAHDIGGEVGEPLLIELRDEDDAVLESVEIETT